MLGLLAVFVIIALGFYIKLQYEFSKMTPVETGVVGDNLFAIKDGTVNIFFIKDGDSYIAIDAGKESNNVEDGLKKLNILSSQIKAIFFTHSDDDHTAGISLFKNAGLYIAQEEINMIEEKRNRMLFIKNKFPAIKYTTLNEQDTLQIGNIHIRAILTPGHTDGSMCYLVNGKHLFVGDILSIKNGKIGQSNSFFHKNKKSTIQTLSKLSNLDSCQYIYSSHFGIAKYEKDFPSQLNNK